MPGRPSTFAYSRARACCASSRCGTGGLYFLYFPSGAGCRLPRWLVVCVVVLNIFVSFTILV